MTASPPGETSMRSRALGGVVAPLIETGTLAIVPLRPETFTTLGYGLRWLLSGTRMPDGLDYPPSEGGLAAAGAAPTNSKVASSVPAILGPCQVTRST